ncbi:hypothetical protein SEA_STORMINNORM_71 [Gordonia Phage StorminNorm]|uniref:Uncharacterized protein n=1 Tax=Gordonia phage Kroos TaxID=2483671 RepID=A0A3G3M9G0_9CAUD|nr:hypothetical protein J1761_gp70 [Gordonia phage Kroos]AYR03049.1 hypothetical protein SEA_KROOS_70 [Gordonia phage Kroos]UTN91725.1 hypothetical protein SEA_STORMINNORM_71 [Gordonia Phage StorminNorm]
MSDDDEVLSGELVPADAPIDVQPGPDVEPPIVRRGEPRCDAETRAESVYEGPTIGRIPLTVRAQCDLPPDHLGQHRVTMPDRVTTYRW